MSTVFSRARLSRAVAFVVSALLILPATGSTPASQDVTVPTTDGQVITVTWTGTSPSGTNQVSDCSLGPDNLIDHHIINLTVPAGTYNNFNVSAAFHIEWTDPAASFSGSDEILTVEKDGTVVDSSDGSSNSEEVAVSNPDAGAFDAMVCAFVADTATPYTGTLTLTATAKPGSAPDADHDGVPDTTDACPGTPKRTPVQANGCPYPATGPGVPRFFTYMSPVGLADDSGEPSVGCNWKSEQIFTNTNVDETTNSLKNGGTTLFFGGFAPYMSKITFDDCASPANMTWDTKPLLSAATPRAAGDPILFTDHTFGRTWTIQLEPGAGATIDITDDDGTNFIPSDGVATAGYDFDHETIASGPFHAPLTGGVVPGISYAVYYASQGVSDARAWRSDDGGITFGAAVPMFTAKDCAGLHGHVKVSEADGTVYVPDKACAMNGVPVLNGGNASAIVSEDNGLTWNIRPVPDASAATSGNDDPSIGVATDGTVYLGWQSLDGHPRISVSHDRGVHWSTPYDVGASVVNGRPVLNIAFPEVAAGDPNRAAFAFFGSETAGTGDDSRDFPGVYYLYIATTFDGGATWTTQNVTPGDPIQRGGITGADPGRNLLDFFDLSIDKEGRLVVGGEDGCVTDRCIDGPGPGPADNDDAAKGFITRQSGGKRMFAQFDPVEPVKPGAPSLSGGVNVTQDTASLVWPAPDTGASPITGYKVYHRVGTSGPFTLLGTATSNQFDDTTYDKTVDNYYHVTAVNVVGEGPYCKNFHPALIVVPTPCVLPGVPLVFSGAGVSGPSSSGTGQDDLLTVSVAEPADMPDKLVFTMKVNNLTPAPISGYRWYVYFKTPTRAERQFVAMDTVAPGGTSAAPGFVHGTTSTIDNPAAPVGSFTVEGNIDSPASNFNVDGTITLVLDKAAFGFDTGMVISQIAGSIRQTSNPSNGAGLTVDSATASGDYTLVGPEFCVVNSAPTALLTASPLSGVAPLTVDFDASGSSDPDAGDVLKYTFHFGDSGVGPQAGSTTSYTFDTPGIYTTSVQVTDSHGLTALSKSQKITVTPPPVNHAPTAGLTASPASGKAPLHVTLNASSSSDPDSNDYVASYTFNFGDGTANVSQAAPTVQHTYTDANAYSASVVVTDTHGTVSTNTATTQITALTPPVPAPPAVQIENNHLGGALSWLALLPLSLAGLARRAVKRLALKRV